MVRFQHFAIFMAALLPIITANPTRKQQKRETCTRKYIVTLKDNIGSDDVESHLSWVRSAYSRDLEETRAGGIEKTYNINTWNAYSGEFDDAAIETIKANVDVAYVEEDQIFTLSYNSTDAELAPHTMVTETEATWGLGTVSHRTSGNNTYIYDSTAGNGTYAYIIDSGLMTSHAEFGDRATFGYNAVGGPDVDTIGHGTHVAGTIGGTTYGVAKSAALIAVKVCQDTVDTKTSIILEGYNWAVNDIIRNNRTSRSAVSMSLDGPYSAALNAALDYAYSSGVLTIVGAGNDDVDAADTSPASAPHAFTVGAIDQTWFEAPFSNHGSSLDIYAPGSRILSSWIGSTDDTGIISGTSMATPHVTGLALYLMELENLNTPSAVMSRIKELATRDKIINIGDGSPNLILYNGNGA